MSITATSQESNTVSFLTTIAGGIVAALGGLSTTELMAVLGALVAIAGFVVNTWAVLRRDKREQQLAELAIKQAARKAKEVA